jgi:hypothetical protein
VTQPGPLVAAGIGDADHVARGTLHAVGRGEDIGEIRIARRRGRQVEADPGMAGLDAEHAVQAKAMALRTMVGAPDRRDAGADFPRRDGEGMQVLAAGGTAVPHRRAYALLASEVDGRKGTKLHVQPSMRAASWNQRVR